MKINVITEKGEFKTFYNELDEVKENLDYIISVKEQRIKSLEKENSELKNNEYYRKLEDENKKLHNIISNSFIITEEENRKINNWKQKHIESDDVTERWYKYDEICDATGLSPELKRLSVPKSWQIVLFMI